METFLAITSQFPVWLLISLSASGVILGDLSGKYWSTNQQPVFFLLAVLGYALSTFFYLPVLLREGLVITSLLWSLLSIVGFVFIGLVIFKETLTPLQIFGVVLGVIALVILSISER